MVPMAEAMRNTARQRVFVLAGGGSGGHISPALAIAERLAELSAQGHAESPTVRSLFVCSQREVDARMLTRAGADHVAIPAQPPSHRPMRFVRFLTGFRRSVRICGELLREREVEQVVAMGGFVSVPVVWAARSCGTPITLINLDDPPGKANRWTAPRCDRVWSAIDLTARPGFAERVVGMPIRRCAMGGGDPRRSRERLGLDPEKPTVLVTGASQGAASLNRFMMAMAGAEAPAFEGWQVYHLTGPGSDAAVREAYGRSGIAGRVDAFLDEIGLAWDAADLAVSRAGANSVAEAAANAVPTLFLPYPHHRDMHQVNNAQPLVEAGGAMVARDHVDAEANVEHVGPVLRMLMSDESRRDAMRRHLEGQRPGDAALRIAEMLLEA